MSLQFSFELDLDDFHLSLEGQIDAPITGVFGHSGCGKTTFLHLLAGLKKPDRGYLKLGEQTLYHHELGVWVPPHQRRIAVVFQEARLFPHLTVLENLQFGYTCIQPEQRRFESDDILRWLNLQPLIDKPIAQLSGGERQRVALGRALLSSPNLLLLDEPLTGLDRGRRRTILNLLLQIQEQTDIPMIHVSHDLGELLQLSDRLWLMEQGRLAGHDHFLELVTKPSMLELFHDLGLLNVMKMEVLERDETKGITTLRPLEGGMEPIWFGPLHENGDMRLYASLRPEDIALVRHRVEGTSIQNQILGRIESVVNAGPRVLVVVSTSIRLLVEITPHAAQALSLTPGMDIYCMFKAHALRYL